MDSKDAPTAISTGISTPVERYSEKGISAVKPSVYDDEDIAVFFEPVAKFEGIHRVDHSATWTEVEEKTLVRKINTWILPWSCLMFMSLQLDRANISMIYSYTWISAGNFS
jgi:hypothetical protein